MGLKTGMLAAALAGVFASGCDAERGAGITGLLMTTDNDLERYGDTVILRAVPDHIDGFLPNRPYLGRRVLSASCPLEHTDIPLDFFMYGDNRAVRGAPPRWLLLGWIGDEEDETWPSEGQLYGATTFEFDSSSSGSSWADGVFIELDTVFE